MFATIRRYKVKAGSTPEVVQRVQDGLIPLLSRQPGFVTYYAIDSGNDVATSVSVYVDKPSADAANKTAAQWVNQNLVGLLGAPEVTVGEIVASSEEEA